jgi:hypothetical protein
MNRGLLVILVAVIAFALLASKTEPYGLAPKKKMDKKKKTKKKNMPVPNYSYVGSQDTGGVGGGLVPEGVYIGSRDDGGVGGGLVKKRNINGLEATMLPFASKFRSHLKTYCAADARVAPLLALWSGDFRTDKKLPTEFSIRKRVLVMRMPQQWNSGEFYHMRTKLLQFLAGRVTLPKDATYMARFLDTWGFYLRVATEKLGYGMRSPQCIANGSCDRSMCPKCKM